MLALNNTDLRQALDSLDGLPDLTATVQPLTSGLAKFDLGIGLVDDAHAGGASGVVEYACDLFDEVTARSLADRFVRVLAEVVSDPDAQIGAVTVLDDAEFVELVERWNDTSVSVPDLSVVEMFARRTAMSPDSAAVVVDDVVVSVRGAGCVVGSSGTRFGGTRSGSGAVGGCGSAAHCGVARCIVGGVEIRGGLLAVGCGLSGGAAELHGGGCGPAVGSDGRWDG